ncbi:MAG: VOC family protein, partial [Acidimicrobiales bacterium]
VHVRYLVDDVAGAIDFYTKHFGFTARSAGFKPNDVIDLTIEPADTGRVASVYA